jgi:hypothetical protein
VDRIADKSRRTALSRSAVPGGQQMTIRCCVSGNIGELGVIAIQRGLRREDFTLL